MIYWCEGVKDDGYVAFTNSDPQLTRLFIDLLCKTFEADRSKFSAIIHLHEYHNPEKQKKFWANALNFFPTQFKKHYLKPNTAKRYRENYPGCISVRYYDTILARKLLFFAEAYMGV